MFSDEELYRQYLSGDEAGLDSLMQKYGNSLTLYINGYLHDLHEAEDLMIDVFSYLFTKKPSIRDGGLKAYMYKAASLLLIVGLSAYMPEFTGQLSADSYSHYEMTASIFHNNNALSYIIVGLAAFILGVGVTILGVRIHHLNKTQQSAMDKGDEEDGAD